MKYQRHSATSYAAAYEIESSAKTLRATVLNFISGRKEWGATDDETQRFLGMNPSTQRPRRIELVEKGLVEDNGMKRLTKSHRSATVWALVTPPKDKQGDLFQ